MGEAQQRWGRQKTQVSCPQCGELRTVAKSTASSAKKRRCRTCASKRREDLHLIDREPIPTLIPREKWRSWRSAARYRGIPWSLTAEELDALHRQQQGRCALTSRLLDDPADPVSLDRIDPDGCYEIGNVQLTTASANRAKLSLSQDEFISMCRDVTAHANALQRCRALAWVCC